MAHTDSEVTDVLDKEASIATISMSGLGLFCFTEQGGFEGGFIRLPSHKYKIIISQVGAGGPHTKLSIAGLDGDVDVKVINPARAVAHRFEKGVFDRVAGANDPEDFRWILDMEGPEMHAEKVAPSGRAAPQGGKRLSRLTINAGTFYTKAVSQEEYARVRTDVSDAPAQLLGSIAVEIGVEIECTDEEGSGLIITINNGAKTELFLPAQSDVKYQLAFSNDCPDQPGDQPDGSDFRLFYDIIRDSGGRKFDLPLAVGPDDPSADDGVPLDDAGTKFRGGLGLVCDKVFLGQTSSLSQFS